MSAAIVIGVAGRVTAAPAPAMSIAEARQQAAAIGSAARPGPTVTLQGVITVAPLSLSATARIAQLEDVSGGIRLFSRHPEWPAVPLQVGDTVVVAGTLRMFRGEPELYAEDTQRVGGGPSPMPREITTADLLSGRYNGLLVKLHGTIATRPDAGAGSTTVLVIRDSSGEVALTVPARFFRDAGFASRAVKGGEAWVVGIAGRDGSNGPGFVPRTVADITFAPTSYVRVVIGAVIIVAGASVLYLWIGRRRIERRARDLVILSERLKASEEAVRRSEASFRSLVQNAACGIYRSTLDGRFLEANPALSTMLGYDSPDALTGLDVRDVYVDQAERDHLIDEFRNTGDTRTAEVTWKRKDGTPVRVRLSGRIIHSDEGPTFEMVAEDVTARRQLEDQLRASQRLESIGQLAGGVAHDVNNVLTAILGYSELALERIEPHDLLRDDIQEIKKAADRATTLTRQLLAFSRRQVLAPKVLNLDSLVASLVPMLRRLIGESVQLTMAGGGHAGAIKADPGQIEQVIVNLVVNARDAMPIGGTVTIATFNASFATPQTFREMTVPPGKYVCVSVSDKGIGMDTATQDRVFEPFFTTKPQGKGTGLGLSTVYGIVKQSDGYITIQSTVGRGTTFQLFFPQVPQAAQSTSDVASTEHSVARSGTILLVEDEAPVRELLKKMLESRGFTVLCASGLDQAVRLCTHHRSPIQLLLTDVVMPQSSGRAVAQAVERLRPGIPVLYMSGHTDDELLRHGVASGDTSFVQKPFTSQILLGKVDAILERLNQSPSATTTPALSIRTAL